MTDLFGATRYVRLFERIGATRARAMVDKLQIVALTSPETLHELEAFLDRNLGLESATSPLERRRGKRPPTELLDDDDDDDDDDPTTDQS
jgi:hypothetical protein